MFPFNSKPMKLFLRYLQVILLLGCLQTGNSFAQTTDYVDTKEKVYLQTNHVFFKRGEDVFFKMYVVNAKDQTPSRESDIVKVDIVSPAGIVVKQLKFQLSTGYAEGSFTFDEQAPGGVYKLKAYTSWMQNEKERSFFTKEITLQQVIAPRVLMKLDFPRKGYGPGDEVTAEYEMRSLANQPIANLDANYTVQIKGVAVALGSFKTNRDGKYRLKFRLPADLNSNDGLLNITVNYDAYTEAISRSIPITLNKIDLQFMPEGGAQVNGIPNNLAFRAIDEYGKPVDIEGEIRDNKGIKVAAFQSYKFGMGRFRFTPLEGQAYSAVITSPLNIKQEFKLPAALDEGLVMNVYREDGRLRVKLITTEDRQVQLVGQTKNVSYYNSTISLRKGEQVIDINESTFPAGIAQFTVYSDNHLPLAERLCFLNGNNTLHVAVATDKPKYQPREKVVMTLKTVDDKGAPVPANFSLAVVDDKLWTLADDKQDNIMSWLLMSSELQGKIEEPQFYFKKNEEKAAGALDLVMLTHGYRYFDFIPAVQKEHRLWFVPGQDNVLGGLILNSRGQPVKANVYLVETSGINLRAIQMQTGDDGGFFFTGVMPYVNYLLIAQGLGKREKVKANVLENGGAFGVLSGRRMGEAGVIPAGIPAAGVLKAVGQEEKTTGTLNGLLNGFDDGKGLSEVVVVGYGTVIKELTGAVTSIKSYDLPAPNSTQALLSGRVAGIEITQEANSFASSPIVLRGSRSLSGDNMPLIIVDGIPVRKGELNISPDEVLSVTVLKDASAAALYGSRGAYGVILITTRQRSSNSIRVDLSRQSHYTTAFVPARGNPYTIAKKFYVPQYTSIAISERNDFRETIYWNPVVQTDRDGDAKVEFYNSDATTTFRAIAEGIGYNGKVGRAETTYVAQHMISVDVKIPPYLTVGDKALLPLVVKNNSGESRMLSIRAEFPAGLKAGSYAPEIILPADSARQVLIPMEVTAAVKGKIHIITGTGAYEETLSLPVETVDKGFPLVYTFSGNRSATHQFNIGNIVPGSLKGTLKLYKDVAGRFADDMAALLRAPYGCFEQTSSTTYPNIFILKYLKETGRSNPVIEKKARDFIEAGYKRLISFETSENGFEWFGRTPAHEPLTAYGLLEFTDMQEFVKVDKGMLQRTKDFLLKRRDGKGGFRISPGAYHFHAIPENMANIYIVYAMTQAGYGNEIQREYKASVEKALAGREGYELLLAALSASNMKDKDNFEKLMKRLSNWYPKSDFKSGASVMGSGGISLKVELLSLYALALMREEPCKTGLVADIISKILEARSFYGYGSTQSTLLALNALVQYSKMVTGPFASKTDFTLDGAAVVAEGDVTDKLKEGKHNFSVQYKNEKETIPYNFEVSYLTFIPPNSPEAVIKLATNLSSVKAKVGETVRMDISVRNEKSATQAMTIAMIGIPAGLSAQPWQLKELTEKNQVAYYEIFDNYLVLYWRGFEPNENKQIHLDLKAEMPGTYKGKASNTYLYYTPEYKHWNEGLEVEIQP